MTQEQAKDFFIDQFTAIRTNQLHKAGHSGDQLDSDQTLKWLNSLKELPADNQQFIEHITPQVQAMIDHLHKTFEKGDHPKATAEERKILDHTEQWLDQYQKAATALNISYTHKIKTADGLTMTRVSSPTADQPMQLEPEQVLVVIEKNLVKENLNSAWEKTLELCYHISGQEPAASHEEYESITDAYFKIKQEPSGSYKLIWKADTPRQMQQLRATLLKRLREANPHHKTIFYAQQLTRLLNKAVVEMQQAS